MIFPQAEKPIPKEEMQVAEKPADNATLHRDNIQPKQVQVAEKLANGALLYHDSICVESRIEEMQVPADNAVLQHYNISPKFSAGMSPHSVYLLVSMVTGKSFLTFGLFGPLNLAMLLTLPLPACTAR